MADTTAMPSKGVPPDTDTDPDPDHAASGSDKLKLPPAVSVSAGTTTTVITAARPPPSSSNSAKKPARFWIIVVALSLLAFISALDAMIIGTALPRITLAIGADSDAVYVWVANCFVFAASALQPLIGQLANILGRKPPLVASIVLFTVGSGVAGGANNAGMFISGRTIQGIGAGGIYVLIDIVCCDLVPLRERGKYLGLINAWAGVAAALGPAVGGALAQGDGDRWRWIFWMNIPICGVALLFIVLFMHVKSKQTAGVWDLDYFGYLLFIPSVISLLLGLVTGGIVHPWSSYQVVVPIVLGVVGWAGFHVHEHWFARNPGVPSRLFGNRTSATAFALSFWSSVLLQTAGYFLPVYFQAVLGTTVLDSGVYFLPFAIGTLFFAVIGGLALTKFGAYRPIHAIAFGLGTVGFGLFTLLNEATPRVAWAWYELIMTMGLGMTVSTILPAIMAGLPEGDVAAATAAFSFIKTFGFVWGVTIPSIIFNAVFNNNLYRISSDTLRGQLADGGAYSFASRAHDIAGTVDAVVWGEVVQVYITSLKPIWWFGLGLSAVAMLMVAGEKALHMSTELETEYGLDDGGSDGAKKDVAKEEKGETGSTSI